MPKSFNMAVRACGGLSTGLRDRVSMSRLVRGVFLAALLASCMLAQSFLGSINGIVMDPTGAVVPNAKVEATDVTTGVKHGVTTNNEGRWALPDLPAGTYVITVNAPGFKETKSTPIVLTAQQTSRFDATLQVGTNSQSIEVTAGAATLNTENAEIDDLRPREDLVNMPLDRRSTISFFFMTSSNYQGDGSSYSLGGLRGVNTNFTVDGVSSNGALWGGQSGPLTEESFEAIRDMKLIESNTSAEFPNVATVLIASRSGENTPHGSLFYTQNNNALNAPCWACAGEKPKGPNRHEFGGSFGGPVILPKIYDGRNKTFFYYTWEHNTFPAGGWISTANVPTLAMKSGDFSKLSTVITDPTTGQPFPGNIISPSRISPVSQGLQNFGFLDPNTGDPNSFINNWRGLFSAPEHTDRMVIRGDHHIGNNDTISGRGSFYIDDMPVGYDSNLPQFQHAQTRDSRQGYLSETHTFTPNLLNELRLGFARDNSHLAGITDGLALANQVGLEGIHPNGAHLGGVPNVSFNNFNQMNEDPTYYYMFNTYELLDNLTWQKGTHNIKAGMLIRYAQPSTSPWINDDFGAFTFNGFATGFDYADFLLGIPQSDSWESRTPNRYNRYTNTGMFVQDAWNVTPKLTLNVGVRWEYFMPPVDKNDMRFAFDPATGDLVVPNQKVKDTFVNPLFSSSIPIVTAQQAGWPGGRSLVNGQWKDFSPRFGFAYRLTNRTVIRGGYGFYYTGLTDALMGGYYGGPFGAKESFTNQIVNGVPRLQFPDPFGGVPEGVGTQSLNPGTADPNLKTPRTQQWNVTVEHEFGKSIVARATYRGFMETQIPYSPNLNTPPASTDPNNINNYRYANFSQLYYIVDGGIQKLNALDLNLERKFSSGLTFQVGYTLAKNITDVQDDGEYGYVEDPYNRARDMGNVYWMPRQRFVGNLLYEVPFGRGKQFGGNLPKIANGVLGNWQITLVAVKQTGQFMTATYAGDSPNVRANEVQTNSGLLRADCIGNGQASDPTNGQWLNPAAFAVPAPGMYGNCAKGGLVGPGLTNVDIGLHKFFNLTEKAKLQIQARATNAFNHPNFATPSTNISAADFGVITGTIGGRYDTLGAGSRVIRIGFRLDF